MFKNCQFFWKSYGIFGQNYAIWQLSPPPHPVTIEPVKKRYRQTIKISQMLFFRLFSRLVNRICLNFETKVNLGNAGTFSQKINPESLANNLLIKKTKFNFFNFTFKRISSKKHPLNRLNKMYNCLKTNQEKMTSYGKNVIFNIDIRANELSKVFLLISRFKSDFKSVNY